MKNKTNLLIFRGVLAIPVLMTVLIAFVLGVVTYHLLKRGLMRL